MCDATGVGGGWGQAAVIDERKSRSGGVGSSDAHLDIEKRVGDGPTILGTLC